MAGCQEPKSACEKCGEATSPQPFFSTENVKLYQSNVLHLLPCLPAGAFDLVVTDPPYCSGGQSAGARQADPVKKYAQSGEACGRPSFTGDHLDQRSFTNWCRTWLEECLRVSKDGAYLAVFIDWRNLPAMTDAVQQSGWLWRGILGWDKGLGSRAPHKGYCRHQLEYLVWATKGSVRKRLDAGPFPGCYRHTVKKNDKYHLTGKPTELMRELVRLAPVGGHVLDPFAGSFTTAVACQIEGRNCSASDLSRDYCKIGRARLERLESLAQS